MSIQSSFPPTIASDLYGCVSTATQGALASTEVQDLAEVLSAIGDATRIQILDMISHSTAGEICACSFVGPLQKSQPTISHHLKILAGAGLVNAIRRGRWVWYSVNSQRLEYTIKLIEDISTVRGQDDTSAKSTLEP